MSNKKFNPARNAFRSPKTSLLIGSGALWAFAYLLANPDKAPDHIQILGHVLGPRFSDNLFKILVYLHTGEAALALLICLKRGYYSFWTTLKWVVSILYIGFPQTKHLLFKTEE